MLASYNKPRQRASLLSWLFFGPCLALSLAFGIDQSLPWLPFFLSIFLFGLHHGAADWLLLRPRDRSHGLLLFSLYSAVGALAWLIAYLSPALAIIAFFALTAVHFGLADERDLRSFSPAAAHPGLTHSSSGVIRMGAFLSSICALGAGEVISLFQDVSRLLGRPEALPIDAAAVSLVSLVLCCALFTLWLISQLVFFLSNRRRETFARITVDAGEALLLAIAAFYLHPVFAVGLYFLCWHAFRHSLLVSRELDPGELFGGFRWQAVLRSHMYALPLSLPIIPLMGFLLWWNGSVSAPTDWVAALLVVCLIFTLPHHFIVEKSLGQTIAPPSPANAVNLSQS